VGRPPYDPVLNSYVASSYKKQIGKEGCIMKFLSRLNDGFDISRTKVLKMSIRPFPQYC